MLLVLFLFATAVVAYFTLGRLRAKGIDALQEPPSPSGWLPLVGHLCSLGRLPHIKLQQLAAKYGPIISLQLGSFSTVVINDGKAIRKAFSNPLLCGRPHIKLLQEVSEGGKGIVSAEGARWKEQRDFFLRHLALINSNPLKQLYEQKIQSQVDAMVANIDGLVEQPVCAQHLFHPYVINTMIDVIYGKTYRIDDPFLKTFAEGITRGSNIDGIREILGLYFPKLSDWFPQLTGHSRRIKIARELQQFVKELWKERKATLAGTEPEDLSSVCVLKLQSMEDSGDSNKLEDTMLFSLADLFVGGFEATCNQLEWILYYMAKHPEEQEKLQKEIDCFIQTKGHPPTVNDRPHLVYTEAILNECMRAGTIAPLGFLHSSMADCQLEGYHIRKGSLIMGSLYGAHHDPAVWDQPDEFKPERFIDSDGKLKRRVEELMPFSCGRRSCIGETLARQMLFLYTVNIFRHFSMKALGKVPEGSDFGISIGPKPFYVKFLRRST